MKLTNLSYLETVLLPVNEQDDHPVINHYEHVVRPVPSNQHYVLVQLVLDNPECLLDLHLGPFFSVSHIQQIHLLVHTDAEHVLVYLVDLGSWQLLTTTLSSLQSRFTHFLIVFIVY